MKYRYLLAAVAASAISVGSPAYAQENGDDEDITYTNNIDTSVVTDVTYYKWVGLFGGALVRGEINPDSSAVAVTDAKQVLKDTTVNYREENELNGENGFVSPVFGGGFSEAGQDPNDNLTDGVFQGQIRVGFFAPIINTVSPVNIDGSGNIGLNMAAGYFNMQLNSAALSVSNNDDEEASGGWAEASTTGFQSLDNVNHSATPGDILDEDDPEQGGGANNFRDRNTAAFGTINGSGNIGVNAAAGAFNQQANLMTLAVASNSVLSEANAALYQLNEDSYAEQQDSINVVSGGPIGPGASGNIGVNVASGVGNQQMNSLTVATSSGSGSGSGNGTGGGSDPS